MELKQVILVRQDLKMPKGKLAAQCSHASIDAAMNSEKSKVDEWKKTGMKKVILKVKDESELLDYLQMAKAANLKTALVIDAGKTVLEPGTKTCVGIGPDEEEKINKITGNLKML